MANDKTNDNNFESNGQTPNQANKINATKRSRYDDQRNLSNISISDDSENELEDKAKELERQKQKNKDLKFIVGKLQKQLNDLTKEMEKMNNLLSDMQSEKKQLYDLLQKNVSRKKTPTKKKVKKSTPNVTQQQLKPNATNIQSTSASVNVTERENSSLQANSAHAQDTQASVHANDSADEVEMFEHKNDSHNKNDHLSESEEEENSESEEEEKEDDESNNIKNTQTVRRSLKVPPVDVWTDNRAEIQREIKIALPNDSCLFGRVNNGKFRVFPCDVNTRSKLIEFLNEKKYEYNTYTPANEKMINVLIKGLDHVNDPNVIKAALAEKGFSPFKIQKHTTGYMRKNNIKSNLWLIVLQPNTDTKELFSIKAIDHAIIKFDFLRKPKVIQCKRCQRFNHSASNCSLPYRCVKCTNKHEPGNCLSDTKGNKFKPKCVNCQGNHTANDAANCAVFKRVIELKTSKQKGVTKPIVSIATTKPSAERTTQSYADRLKMNKTVKQVNNRENININNFINNQNKMMSEFMLTMKKMQQQFISSFANKNGQ